MNTNDLTTHEAQTRPVLLSALDQVQKAMKAMDDATKPRERVSVALAAVRVVTALERLLGLPEGSDPEHEEADRPA